MTTEVIQPMLAETIPDKRDLSRWERTHIAQIKYDGTRCIAVCDPNEGVMLVSRSAKTDYSDLYPEICAALRQVDARCVLDCELAFFRKDTGVCEYVKADALPGTVEPYNPILMVFDVLSRASTDYRDYDQTYRSSLLSSILRQVPTAHVKEVITWESDFRGLYDNVISCGGEGIILKARRGKYRHDGKNQNRSKDWLKVKRDETADCVVMGIQIGKGKTESTFGALVLGQFTDIGLIEVGRTSGMTDAERRILLGMIKHIPADPMSVLNSDKSVSRAIEPRLVVEVEFMEKTTSGRLRHPRYLRMRSDKEPCECVLTGARKR
jgi:bifunctional non-homologous end joining protein LigD